MKDGASPIASATEARPLVTVATLAASGAYTYSSIIDVLDARALVLFCDYDPAATSGRYALIPLVSNVRPKPAAGDDSWFCLPGTDGSVAATALGGAVPSGADWTAAPSAQAVSTGKLMLLGPTAANATDEIRQAHVIDVTHYHHIQIAYAEHGVTGTPGALGITYALSI